MDTLKLAGELERLIGMEAQVDDDRISFQVDRGPRVDHGGGSDGDEWLSSDQVDRISDEYKQKHQDKLYRIKQFIEDNEIGASVYWEYGEKGHCSIEIYR